MTECEEEAKSCSVLRIVWNAYF